MPESAPGPDRLVVEDLVVQAGSRELVSGVSLSVPAGSVVALVGASGSGKTMTARACLGLVRPRPGVVAGQVEVHVGGDVIAPYAAGSRHRAELAFRAVRGRLVGYLPQDAVGSLDPLWRVGRQLQEVLDLREGKPPADAVYDWLRRAGFRNPAAVADLFPHELSGGMAQRACIALALARGSRFLLADEPTTGLDPTVQRAILQSLAELRDDGLGILLITHDLRIIPGLADEVVVMHAGRIVDCLAASELHQARSPHTLRLVDATARISGGLL